MRSWMMKTYAAALEDERAEIRRSACIALRVLKAAEYLQELLHVVYNDLNLAIVEEAKLAVQSFGKPEYYLIFTLGNIFSVNNYRGNRNDCTYGVQCERAFGGCRNTNLKLKR